MKQRITAKSNLVPISTNDHSSLSCPSQYKAMQDHCELKLNKNQKKIVFGNLLTEMEGQSDLSGDNNELCHRSNTTTSTTNPTACENFLDTSEHQDNQTTNNSFTDGSFIKCDAVITKESIPKCGNAALSSDNGLSKDVVALAKTFGITALRSRFSGHTTTSDFNSNSSSLDCKHHLGPQMICQTLAEEVRELKLLAHAALPDWLKDNDFLLSSHRPPMPCIATCFRTVFSLHSETVNIWTHLIGSLILVGITFWFFVRPNDVPYTWQKVLVFLAFFLSAVACMTFSWLYHTLYCHSMQMNKLFSKLDYSGIAILVLGSFVPWLYYGFYCDQAHMIFYIISMVVLSTCCIVFSLWEKFAAPTYRPMRTATFIGLGLSGVVPFAHGVWKNGLESTRFAYTATVALLYIGGALIYVFRVPERFLPGKLDIWGHSHQIFHVLVVIAAVVHYNGITTMAEDRHLLGECHT